MRMPSYLFREKVKIKPFNGNNAYGVSFGEEYFSKCRIEPVEDFKDNANPRQMVTEEEIVARFLVYFPHNVKPFIQSKVTWNGREFTIIGQREVMGFTSVSYVECVMA